MLKRAVRWIGIALVLCGISGLGGQQAQAASYPAQHDAARTETKLGETKRVRFYTFGQSVYGKDVAYVDIVVSNTRKPLNALAAGVAPAQWGGYA